MSVGHDSRDVEMPMAMSWFWSRGFAGRIAYSLNWSLIVIYLYYITKYHVPTYSIAALIVAPRHPACDRIRPTNAFGRRTPCKVNSHVQDPRSKRIHCAL